MKVNITKESKKWLTVDEYDRAKEIVRQMKDDEWSAEQYVDMAAICWLRNTGKNDYRARVIEASAEIAKNSRAGNAFNDDSGTLDVWMKGLVETWDGFLKIECYLTDIWSIGPESFNKKFPEYCWARYYTEQK